ncbi:hypothetical protein WA158_007264 [Blastocystis sp. Blastoise]
MIPSCIIRVPVAIRRYEFFFQGTSCGTRIFKNTFELRDLQVLLIEYLYKGEDYLNQIQVSIGDSKYSTVLFDYNHPIIQLTPCHIPLGLFNKYSPKISIYSSDKSSDKEIFTRLDCFIKNTFTGIPSVKTVNNNSNMNTNNYSDNNSSDNYKYDNNNDSNRITINSNSSMPTSSAQNTNISMNNQSSSSSSSSSFTKVVPGSLSQPLSLPGYTISPDSSVPIDDHNEQKQLCNDMYVQDGYICQHGLITPVDMNSFKHDENYHGNSNHNEIKLTDNDREPRDGHEMPVKRSNDVMISPPANSYYAQDYNKNKKPAISVFFHQDSLRRGLINTKNICYMISIIQCLSHNADLVEFVTSSNNINNKMITVYKHLFYYLIANNITFKYPYPSPYENDASKKSIEQEVYCLQVIQELCSTYKQLYNINDIEEQNDAGEFLMRSLDCLFPSSSSNSKENGVSSSIQNNQSDCYCIKTNQVISCLYNNHKHASTSVMSLIPVNMPPPTLSITIYLIFQKLTLTANEQSLSYDIKPIKLFTKLSTALGAIKIQIETKLNLPADDLMLFAREEVTDGYYYYSCAKLENDVEILLKKEEKYILEEKSKTLCLICFSKQQLMRDSLFFYSNQSPIESPLIPVLFTFSVTSFPSHIRLSKNKLTAVGFPVLLYIPTELPFDYICWILNALITAINEDFNNLSDLSNVYYTSIRSMQGQTKSPLCYNCPLHVEDERIKQMTLLQFFQSLDYSNDCACISIPLLNNITVNNNNNQQGSAYTYTVDHLVKSLTTALTPNYFKVTLENCINLDHYSLNSLKTTTNESLYTSVLNVSENGLNRSNSENKNSFNTKNANSFEIDNKTDPNTIIIKYENPYKEDTLQKALYNYFNEDFAYQNDPEWYCDVCQKKSLYRTKHYITQLPSYIIIHLDRTVDSGNGQQAKSGRCISFPFTDLSFDAFFDDHSKTSENGYGNRYDLVSVCYHTGDLNGGHYYTSCCDTIDGVKKWFSYSDMKCEEIDENMIVTMNALYLFYQVQGKPIINRDFVNYYIKKYGKSSEN